MALTIFVTKLLGNTSIVTQQCHTMFLTDIQQRGLFQHFLKTLFLYLNVSCNTMMFYITLHFVSAIIHILHYIHFDQCTTCVHSLHFHNYSYINLHAFYITFYIHFITQIHFNLANHIHSHYMCNNVIH